ncbi:MAG: SprB repeat-containing protein [Bacteroidota bacterium]|nr:SprB repeat-containing protein [Bacteroidota bacterium]
MMIFSGGLITHAQLSVTLNPSDYNGYAVSCFGQRNGSISATVTGGIPPYTYIWSTGELQSSISGIAAGYYNVMVTDASNSQQRAEITLVQPDPLKGEVTPYEYPNQFNISCNQCYNGSINLYAYGGVAPYSYQWRDGSTSEDRMGLGARDYQVNIMDSNGCEYYVPAVDLREPQRSDWTMQGNTGTNPINNYIGTSDAQDFVLKSNGTERLRLLSTGELHMSSATNEIGHLFRGPDGILKLGDGEFSDYGTDCLDLRSYPYWKTNGNSFPNLCPSELLKIGTKDNRTFDLITNNQTRLKFPNNGGIRLFEKTSIGVNLNTSHGMLTIKEGNGDWLTLLNSANGKWHVYNPVEEDRIMIHYADVDNISPGHTVLTLWNNGKVSIGDVNVNTSLNDYGLYVHKGILTERVKVAIATEGEWSDHVFDSNYKLLPLSEVEAFIRENNHLPGVPSAECMVEEGLDVATTDALLLQKVEELSLYLILLEKRLFELEEEKSKLKRSEILND